MRFHWMLAALLALSGAAGCLEAPEETADPGDSESLPTKEAEPDRVPPAVGCVEPGDAPAGYGDTGAIQPDEVGTGTGDITSEVACPEERPDEPPQFED